MLTEGNLIVTTSWDDGVITDLRLAELLDECGVDGTFYVSRTSAHNLLSQEDIAAIGKRFEIGAHTVNHPDLTGVSLSQAEEEIEASKTYLEDLLGHPVAMFCYPYGRYNDDLARMVRDKGFTGARTCQPGGFNLPQNPYQWHITLLASNASPLMALQIWWQSRLWQVGALFDWESRAKLLFDLALEKGGIYSMYGHSEEFERKSEWDKLKRVLMYIANRKGVQYLTNGKIFELLGKVNAG